MDGRTIELNIEKEAFIEFSIGMKGQLISGLEKIIPSLYLNEATEVIVPYDLAFGERGVPGVVAPYSPLRYVLMVRDAPLTQEVAWEY